MRFANRCILSSFTFTLHSKFLELGLYLLQISIANCDSLIKLSICLNEGMRNFIVKVTEYCLMKLLMSHVPCRKMAVGHCIHCQCTQLTAVSELFASSVFKLSVHCTYFCCHNCFVQTVQQPHMLRFISPICNPVSTSLCFVERLHHKGRKSISIPPPCLLF